MDEKLLLDPTLFTLVTAQNQNTYQHLLRSLPAEGQQFPVLAIRIKNTDLQFQLLTRGLYRPLFLDSIPGDEELLVPLGGGNRVRACKTLGLQVWTEILPSWDECLSRQLSQRLPYKHWWSSASTS